MAAELAARHVMLSANQLPKRTRRKQAHPAENRPLPARFVTDFAAVLYGPTLPLLFTECETQGMMGKHVADR